MSRPRVGLLMYRLRLDDKDASLDDMLTEFDRRMKEQETSGR